MEPIKTTLDPINSLLAHFNLLSLFILNKGGVDRPVEAEAIVHYTALHYCNTSQGATGDSNPWPLCWNLSPTSQRHLTVISASSHRHLSVISHTSSFIETLPSHSYQLVLGLPYGKTCYVCASRCNIVNVHLKSRN